MSWLTRVAQNMAAAPCDAGYGKYKSALLKAAARCEEKGQKFQIILTTDDMGFERVCIADVPVNYDIVTPYFDEFTKPPGTKELAEAFMEVDKVWQHKLSNSKEARLQKMGHV